MAKLPNYLRTERKRLGLTQEEVATLLGVESGAKVCRYEMFSREPSLHTALAFEVIFGKPVSELFAGMYEKIERDILTRAKTLVQKGEKRTKANEVIADIINRKSKSS